MNPERAHALTHAYGRDHDVWLARDIVDVRKRIVAVWACATVSVRVLVGSD